MSEWYCQMCGRLNFNSDRVGRVAPFCHHCKSPISYDSDLEDLKEERKTGFEEFERITKELDHINDVISSLQDELSEYLLKREDILTERKEASDELSQIEKRLTTYNKPVDFRESLAKDKNQAKLGVFI